MAGMMLHQLFSHGRFSPPATDGQIAAVETDLGIVLSRQLRDLYLECDGFREVRGNAKYLLSLTDDDVIGSLVKTTRFWWEWTARQSAPDFRPYVLFGYSSGDECWGIDCPRGEKIIAYHYQMGGECEVIGSDIIEVYRADYALYGQAAAGIR